MVNILVGIAMGLSVLSAAVFWVHFQWTHDRQILERSHVQQETRALMDTLVHDIRRANFFSLVITPNTPHDPVCPIAFCGASEDFYLTIHQILFSIDRNENGLKENNECSGFRLNGNQPVVWTSLTQPKNLEILALELRLQCNQSSPILGELLLIEIRSQTATEKMPLTWRRGVRLRNSGTLLGNAASNCTGTDT
jgi:hypothetical protein